MFRYFRDQLSNLTFIKWHNHSCQAYKRTNLDCNGYEILSLLLIQGTHILYLQWFLTMPIQDGKLKAVVGASGGGFIIGGTAEVLLNHFVKGLNPFSSVTAPRVYHQVLYLKFLGGCLLFLPLIGKLWFAQTDKQLNYVLIE